VTDEAQFREPPDHGRPLSILTRAISLNGRRGIQFTLKSKGKSIAVICVSSNSSFASDIFQPRAFVRR
jgi:hypothetical protein